MTQFSSEKTFGARLKEIGDLYEEAKDKMYSMKYSSTVPFEGNDYNRVLEIIRELRDIAAVNLKANHEIKSN
jgi:hypothetical protein